MNSEFFKSFDETDNDLLAVRYVGGEMSAAELSEFDELLAESQSARDAVADVVQLFAAVPLAFSDSATAVSISASDSVESTLMSQAIPQRTVRLAQPSRPRSWQMWRGAAWASLGAAACLLAVVGFNSIRHWGESGQAGSNLQNDVVGSNGSSGQACGELALQWTNIAPQTDSLALESATEYSDLSLGSDESSAADADEAIVDSNGATDELSAPSWLLAAVSPPGTLLLSSPSSQDSPATE